MNRHEDSGVPGQWTELYLRAEGSPTVWAVEVLCAEAAVLELGYHPERQLGLNVLRRPGTVDRSGTPDPHGEAVVVLDSPALPGASAMAEAARLLILDGHLPDAPISPARWKDFADHPEAQTIEKLSALIGQMMDDQGEIRLGACAEDPSDGAAPSLPEGEFMAILDGPETPRGAALVSTSLEEMMSELKLSPEQLSQDLARGEREDAQAMKRGQRRIEQLRRQGQQMN